MQTINDSIVLFPESNAFVVKLVTPEQKKVADTIPGVDKQGDFYCFPWTTGACRFLQNIGLDGLSIAPFMYDQHPLVEGKYNAMKHQLLTAAFMTLNPRGYILSTPRTGKTASAIFALDYMQRCRMITGGVLIITTLTTIHSLWKANILDTLLHSLVQVAHGKDREKALQAPAEFYITNYDSVRLSKRAFMQAVEEGRIGAIVIDELTHVGNSTSQRHKAIYELCNKTGLKYVWGMTGSPADNPEMVFGMCRCVNPGRLYSVCTTKTAWLNLTTYQYGPEPFMRTTSPQANELIHKVMQPAIRFDKADILDLPPVTTQVRSCALEREQAEAREALRKQAIALLKSGEQITAVNGGVLMNKLMQVALGIVRDDSQRAIPINHCARTKVILEAIEETDRKVVIFCGYTAALDMMKDEIEGAGHTCEKIDGSVNGTERARILHDFQNSKDPRVLVCHPTTTAMGVELSAADTMIFNGVPMTGGFVYAQSLERLSSSKQTASSINIIHIVATIEERRALKRMEQGYTIGQQIAELFANISIDK